MKFYIYRFVIVHTGSTPRWNIIYFLTVLVGVGVMQRLYMLNVIPICGFLRWAEQSEPRVSYAERCLSVHHCLTLPASASTETPPRTDKDQWTHKNGRWELPPSVASRNSWNRAGREQGEGWANTDLLGPVPALLPPHASVDPICAISVPDGARLGGCILE